jgi:hypothetical protein
MPVITLPSGLNVDFGDLSQKEIELTLSSMMSEKPELFQSSSPEATTQEQATTPAFEITNEGEVESHGFQASYGQADTDEERALRLEKEFGPGTFTQLGRDEFALLLDNISPEKKTEYKLPETGTIRVNQPGFTARDISRFAGAYRGPLVTTTVAGIMTGGIGLIPSMLAVGAAGGAGKAFDEFVVEKAQGLQRQTDDEIWGDVALETALAASGEGIGRGLFAVGRRLIKGPGPKVAPERIEELMKTGLNRKTAKAVATEEARASMQEAIKAGARPTLEEASGKALAGRLQAIYENIFPNQAAAASNREYVQGLLKSYDLGEVSKSEFKQALNDQAQAVSQMVRTSLADKDEGIKTANKLLEQVISKELKLIEDLYVPGDGLTVDFEHMLSQAVRTFEQSSQKQYDNAYNLLPDKATIFKTQPLKQEINRIFGKDANGRTIEPTRAAVGAAAEGKALFQSLKNLPEEISLKQLQSIRQALRLQGKDPELVGTLAQRDIGDLVKVLDDTIEQRAVELKADFYGPQQFLARPEDGIVSPFGPGKDPISQKNYSEGIEAFLNANKFYSEGMETFGSASVNMLKKNIDDKYFIDFQSVSDYLIQPGKPATLKFYLDAVTPNTKETISIQGVPQKIWNDIADALPNQDVTSVNPGQVTVVNQLIDDAVQQYGLDPKVLPKLMGWYKEVPGTDPFLLRTLKEYKEIVKTYGDDSFARNKPEEVVNVMRDHLARQWLQDTARRTTTRGSINFSSVADSFEQLGKEVQDNLFGVTGASALRQTMRDFHLVGASSDELSNIALSSISTPQAREAVKSLQETVARATSEAEDSLLNAVKNGRIEDANSLVVGLMKSPQSMQKLESSLVARRVSEGLSQEQAAIEAAQELDNIRNLTMNKIVSNAVGDADSFTTESVVSGAFAKSLGKVVDDFNANGALAKVLTTSEVNGQKVVDDLVKISRQAEIVSDASLKGKGGLAPAAFAAGAAFRLVTQPISFLGEAGAIFVMGRLLRNKGFLEFMTAPQLTSKQRAAGVKAGAKGIDDPAFQRRLLRVREIVNQEIRLATALGIGGGTAETAETIQEATAPIVEDIKQEVAPAVENFRQEIAPELQNMRTQVDPNLLRQYTPGSTNLTASDVERERARMGIAGLIS